MDYRALYRKFRPSNFDDVSGQEVAVKILKNSIANNKISHAYLFYGPRGTGKTSLAKIFARAVNCLDSKDGIQCEKCENCNISSNSECVDIIEIDAASNNGVDEIRELKSKISFVPANLKYKVYIIDEVHMLSTGAFNALLKTIEEPPSYIIFILATTEFSKVPSTIISRCQTRDFKKISDQNIFDKIKNISKEEKIKIDDEAIYEIARNSNGGLRDSIGLLEKANSYSSKITSDDIRTVTGNVSLADRNNFISLLEKGNIPKLITTINDYYNNGIDLNKFVLDLMFYYSDQLLNNSDINNTNTCSIIKYLDETYSNMMSSNNPKLILEVSILNLVSLYGNTQDKPTVIEEKKLEVKEIIQEKKNQIVEDNSEKQDSLDKLKTTRVYNTLSKVDKKSIDVIRSKWSNLNDLAFDENYGNLARLLVSDVESVAASDEYIVLKTKLNGLCEQINNDLNNVEKILEIILNNSYKVICLSENEWNKYIDLYKKNSSLFVYTKENDVKPKKEKSSMTMKEASKELFED